MAELVDCDNCGGDVERTPYQLKEYDNHFCDNECKNEWLQSYSQGENNPNWDGGPVEITCEWCGDTAKKQQSHIERDEHHFCSPSCNATYHTEHEGGGFQTGEENPAYKGGATTNPRYYGPNWTDQRERALDRDGHECVECGADEQLVVHHINGRDEFDTTEPGWWREANQLENLKTMCRSCHRSEHHDRGDHEHTYGANNEGRVK